MAVGRWRRGRRGSRRAGRDGSAPSGERPAGCSPATRRPRTWSRPAPDAKKGADPARLGPSRPPGRSRARRNLDGPPARAGDPLCPARGIGHHRCGRRDRQGRSEGLARAGLGRDPGGPPPGRRAERPDRRPAPRLAIDRHGGRPNGAEDRLVGPHRRAGHPARCPGRLRDAAGRRRPSSSAPTAAGSGSTRSTPGSTRARSTSSPRSIRPADGPLRLKLGAASTLKNAVVNDEVSHRVLSYAAPVLDGATRVQGRVSVRRARRRIPARGAPATSARVEGDVLFDEVRFLPGPLAEAIIDLLPNPREDEAGDGPMLVLRDPISFRIAERKVYQHGLIVPLGRLGSVGAGGLRRFRETP